MDKHLPHHKTSPTPHLSVRETLALDGKTFINANPSLTIRTSSTPCNNALSTHAASTPCDDTSSACTRSTPERSSHGDSAQALNPQNHPHDDMPSVDSILTLLKPEMCRAAIFDFDGTIAHSMHIWERVDREFFELKGLPYHHTQTHALATLGFVQGAHYLIETYNLSETPEELYQLWNQAAYQHYAREVSLRPGVTEYITALKAHHVPTALATMNDTSVIAGVRTRLKLDNLFDHMVFGADVSRGKDAPDIYLKAAELMDVDPDCCVVFEDIVPGIISAKGVGMLAIGVRSADDTQDWTGLVKHSDATIDGFEELGKRAQHRLKQLRLTHSSIK